jgi:flagellar basal body-associated protein FliL
MKKREFLVRNHKTTVLKSKTRSSMTPSTNKNSLKHKLTEAQNLEVENGDSRSGVSLISGH